MNTRLPFAGFLCLVLFACAPDLDPQPERDDKSDDVGVDCESLGAVGRCVEIQESARCEDNVVLEEYCGLAQYCSLSTGYASCLDVPESGVCSDDGKHLYFKSGAGELVAIDCGEDVCGYDMGSDAFVCQG